VSCTSHGNCVAVGSYGPDADRAMIATESDGVWQQAVPAPNPTSTLSGISCSDPEDCTAVGSEVVSQTGGIWQPAVEISFPSGAVDPAFEAVSCPSEGNCTAVGHYYTASSSEALMAVSEAGGVWQAAVTLDPPSDAGGGYPTGVSCSSAGECTAVGGYGVSGSAVTAAMAITETNGTWSQGVPVSLPSDAGSPRTSIPASAVLDGVSCTTATGCTAVGEYSDTMGNNDAMVVTEVDGVWGQAFSESAPPDLGTIAPFHDFAQLSDVSCADTNDCVAVGQYSIGLGTASYNVAMVATETNGAWQQAVRVQAPEPGPSGLSGVSCASSAGCSAVGGYDGEVSQTDQAMAAEISAVGYWEVASDGGIFSFGTLGSARFYGSMGGRPLNAPIVGMAPTPDRNGYWEVASDGGIFAFGDARFYGSMGGKRLNAPVVAIAPTPDGEGYWEVASDGGIFAFGDAGFYGSMGGHRLNRPVVGLAATLDGKGYWEVASDGGIFNFGTAPFAGSVGGTLLNAPVVGMAASSGGYWEVASDGGIFNFGTAPFLGSMGGTRLAKPVVGMAATSDGSGYWEVASDGGVFNFGSAAYLGSMGGTNLNRPVVGLAAG
jgi:hypothetical protein